MHRSSSHEQEEGYVACFEISTSAHAATLCTDTWDRRTALAHTGARPQVCREDRQEVVAVDAAVGKLRYANAYSAGQRGIAEFKQYCAV